MLKINIEIDEIEYEIELEKIVRDKEILWVTKDLPANSSLIIKEINGAPDDKSMEVSSNISTDKAIIFERFLEELALYNEQVKAGFEPSEMNSDEFRPQPYDPDDIKVRRENFSVFEINRMMSVQKDIDLNPDFQRNLVWDNTRKSALIESILLGIPIPVFYFAESKSGQYHVVDGLQRLSTIKQYFNNEFYLKKLEHLINDCEGKYYMENEREPKTLEKSLDRKYSRRLENAQLIVNVIEYSSPQKVKYDIFKRLNTGGRPLNKQEVRNCIANNKVRKFLKTLSTSTEFIEATGGSISDNRMDDQELILRFIGFNLENKGEIVYSGDMNSFLDDVLDLVNQKTEADLEEYSVVCLRALRINYYLFGEYCFRKCLSEHLQPKARKQTINKALYVTWMKEVSYLDENQIKAKINFASFSKKLAELLDKKDHYYSILTTGTSDKQNLKDASNYAKNLLNENGLI
jgi:uncharacterized protein with ParB-like and HNH nuclease domain